MKKFDLTALVRPNILDLKPYSSARDEFEFDQTSVLMDANENPLPEQFNRYPDPHQIMLKRKLAEVKNVTIDNIFIGNGSDEAIDLLIRIFCIPGSDEILITDPTYGMYKVSAEVNDVKVLKIPLTRNFQLDVGSALNAVNDPLKSIKLIFLCSPGNPSGISLKHSDILELLQSVSIPVIVDEAYIDFSEKESLISELQNYPNLIIMQTFSKALGLAGLRLGMAYASREIVALLEKTKPPYNVNEFSQLKGLQTLEEEGETAKWITQILSERVKLAMELDNLEIVKEVLPSETNFLMVRFSDSQLVFKRLQEDKIIVRDRSKELHCQDCLRITVGTEEENQKLMNKLRSL